MKLFERIIEFDNHKITAVSLVEKPATQEDFISMKKQEIVKMNFDEEKRVVTGVVLTPNQKIYRNDNGLEYEMFFSKDTIFELNQSIDLNVTLDHEKDVKDVFIIEKWISSDSTLDKSNALGLGEMPIGTLFMSMKVNNDETWERVKSKELNGFSIEAMMGFKELSDDELLLKEFEEILN